MGETPRTDGSEPLTAYVVAVTALAATWGLDRLGPDEASDAPGLDVVHRRADLATIDREEVESILLRAIRDVEAGSMTPATASALSQLARAFATIYESGLVEARIAEVEATIEKRVAS